MSVVSRAAYQCGDVFTPSSHKSSEKIKTISTAEVQLAKFEDSQRGRSNSESGIREGLNMMVGFRAEIDIIYVIFRPEQTVSFYLLVDGIELVFVV